MRLLPLLLLSLPFVAPTVSHATDNCVNRGDLDVLYCDADHDLVADQPTDASKFNDPNPLVFTYTTVEGSTAYQKTYEAFMDYLGRCIGRPVEFFQAETSAIEIEAMRSGRLHVAGFSAGPTAFAVNVAGAVPFAIKGTEEGYQGYNLILIVRKDSPFQKIQDLKGKSIAHTSPTSNSGHMAPLALFQKLGLNPDKDYKILFSGKHDQSILGVKAGVYDAAPVASDMFYRMVARRQVNEQDFRILYTSAKFPTASFAHAHNLKPHLRDQLIQCFYEYRFPHEMQTVFEGADRFVPATYKKDWAVIREVAEASSEKFTKAAYDVEAAKTAKK